MFFIIRMALAGVLLPAFVSGQQCLCSTDEALNVRTCGSTSCAVVGVLRVAHCVPKLAGTSGSWREVIFNDESAWLSSNYVVERPCPSRQCVCAHVASASIRSCASSSCGAVASMNIGECATFSGMTSGEWVQIEFSGQSGWISNLQATGPQICADPDTGDRCFPAVCSSNQNNEARTCDSFGCGHYLASRGSRLHYGVDNKCTAGDVIAAPFPGTLVRRSPPYGDGSCCDDGFLYEGTGDWAGFEAKFFYVTAVDDSWGRSFAAGDALGEHIGLHCGCYSAGMTDHAHVQLNYAGSALVDPTSFLTCK